MGAAGWGWGSRAEGTLDELLCLCPEKWSSEVFPQQSGVITVLRAACGKSWGVVAVTLVLLMRQLLSCKVLLIHVNKECLVFKLMPSSRMVTNIPNHPLG